MGYRFSTEGLITEIEIKQTCSKYVLNLLLENVIINQIHSNTFGGGGGDLISRCIFLFTDRWVYNYGGYSTFIQKFLVLQ